jgi:DNA polymerase-3 subunit delta
MITTQEWAKKSAGKWTEAIARVGHFVTVWAVKPNELNEWLEKRLRSRGLSAEPAALQLLADRIEGNLLAAAQEVEKLALLAPGCRLDAAQMERLVADSSRFDVFKLVDSALAGEVSRCARMLRSLRGEGEQVPGLVPILAMELLKLTNLARVVDRGGNVASAMNEARIWDVRQAVYRRALARHPAGRWEEMVAEAGRIDLMAKGRLSGDAWLALERLLTAIAEPRARILLAG